MGASKQKSTTQTQTSQGPWAPAADALKGAIPQVEGVYQQRLGQEFFPGQTYAGFDPSQSEALGGIEGTARNQISTGGLTGAASDYTAKVLAGDYTAAGNPYWGDVAKSVGDPVQAALSAQWSKSGRGTGNTGASGVAADVGKGMTAALAPYQFQAFEAERQRQEAAAGRAPQLDQAAYDPYAALFGAGGARQAMDQQGIAEDVARYDYDQNKGANALAEKLNFLIPMGKLGMEGTSTSTTTATSKPSPMQTIVGAGLTGAGMLSGNPFSMSSILPWLNKSNSFGAAG